MQDASALFRLDRGAADDRDSPALIVQADAGPPAAYSEELYRLYFIESETAALTLEHRAVSAVRGQLLTLSPAERLSFEGPAEVRSFGFHHDFFCVRVKRSEVFCDGIVFNRVTGLPLVTIPEAEWPVLRSRFDELRNVLAAPGLLTEDRAISALRSTLLQAADCKVRYAGQDLGLPARQARISDVVLRFQDLVEQHYTDHKDVGFYCDSLGVTAETLNRRLKEEIGQTAMQAVNERLAIAARVALRSGRKSIKVVAFELGFDDPLYFSRFFKKQFGRPPSQYFHDPAAGQDPSDRRSAADPQS